MINRGQENTGLPDTKEVFLSLICISSFNDRFPKGEYLYWIAVIISRFVAGAYDAADNDWGFVKQLIGIPIYFYFPVPWSERPRGWLL